MNFNERQIKELFDNRVTLVMSGSLILGPFVPTNRLAQIVVDFSRFSEDKINTQFEQTLIVHKKKMQGYTKITLTKKL